MDNLIACREGATHYFNTENWQAKLKQVVMANPKVLSSYIKKKKGNKGWIGDTIS